MTSPRTLIIIPAFNEEEALPAALKDLDAHRSSWDVLVVDDGSSDATASVALRAGVAVATLPFNLGIGGALRTGFRYAARHGYERAVQFDADGQHLASQIQELLAPLDDGSDLVVGTRFGRVERDYRVGMLRKGAMRFLRLAVALLSGRSFTDTSSGFRAFSRPMLCFFANSYPAEYMDSVEALLLAVVSGYQVTEVPVQMQSRSGGQPSQRNLRLLYHYLRLLVVLTSSISLRGRRRKDVRA